MATVNLLDVKYYVVAVLSDGKQANLETVAENIAWEENEKELAARLNLTLRDADVGGKKLAQLLALCTVVYLYADWGTGKQEIFRGTIWEWENSRIDGDPIIVTCYDLLYYLQKSTDSKYYPSGKMTKAIIKDILDTWEMELDSYTAPNVSHQKILYKTKTVSSMITETLDKAKRLDGMKSVVRAVKGKVSVLKYGGNSTIYGFDADSSLSQTKDKYSMTSLVTRVTISGKEDSDGRPKIEATVDGKISYGILQANVNQGSSTLDEAKEEAQTMLDEKGSPTRAITLQAPDFPAIRKGDLIHAKTDKLVGYFYVKGITHNATTMQMQMEVEPK